MKELNSYLPVDIRNPVNRNHPLTRGMIAWWICLPGLVGGKTWYDIHDNNSPGTLFQMTGGNGWVSSTRLFGSMLFDGTLGVVDLGTPPNLSLAASEMTVVANVKPNAVDSTGHGILSDFVSNTQETFRLVIRATNLWGVDWRGATTYSLNSVSTPIANTWYHIAGIRQGSLGNWRGRITINGIPDSTSTTAINAVAGAGWAIGAFGAGHSSKWNGNIADVIVYNRALSIVEVQSLYRESLANYPNMLNRVAFTNRGLLDLYFTCWVGNFVAPFFVKARGG